MELRRNIYSVGVTDSAIRMFHGYQTPVGTTYNSYLIIDDKVTLIDFVKCRFAGEFIANLKNILGSRPIDYIICNHVEPDHSGALPEVMKEYPFAVIYGTASCEKELRIYYKETPFDFITVKNGDSLKTGEYTFDFRPMPMVHWPDSMATYLPEEGILFSNDAFGQHIGTGEARDVELTLEYLLERAGDYYANIILPYGAQVKKVLDSIKAFDINMICPSHGVILEKYISQIIEKYSDWCENKTDDKKVVIIYDTMWGTTRKLAGNLSREYAEKGFTAEIINLSEKHYSYALSRLLEAKYIFVGSPTLNNQIMPTVSAFLTYMKGLRPKNRIGLAFGSCGWSGESTGQINDIMASCGFEMLAPVKAVWNI